MSIIKDVLGENLSKLNDLVYSAVLRALSKNKIIQFSEHGFEFKNESSKKCIAIKPEALEIQNSSRGFIDFNSLTLRYNNEKIFKKYFPKANSQKSLFNILNTARSLSIGFKEYIGCKENIYKILDNNVFLFNSKDKNSIPERYYKDFFNFFLKNFQKRDKDSVNSFLKRFPKIDPSIIENLIKNISNQEKFLKVLLDFINLVSQKNILSDNSISDSDKKKNQKETKNLSQPYENYEKIQKELLKKEILPRKKVLDKKSHSNLTKDKTQFNYFNSDSEKYKIFTKKFDLFTNAKRMASFQQLKVLRKQVDDEFQDDNALVTRLAKKLEKLLYSANLNHWKFDQEEGIFDGSRFSNFIANPNYSSIFKLERENTAKNTIVSLLLDNSGSMRGKPIITAAKTTEIITRMLEKCKVQVEVLGFTTREWKGGKSRLEWDKYQRPANPGRLNDLLHIVYKDANSSWKSCRNNLGLIIKEGLLKENIDGEALIWASDRLLKRSEKKKILIVISDGAPVDDSTLSANNSNILDIHLKKTVSELEKKRRIHLLAIGIGHDVSKYYNNAFTIDDVSKLGEVMVDNLTKILKPRNF